MKPKEIRQKSREEIQSLLAKELLDLGEVRRNTVLGKEKNTSLIGKKRCLVARLKTVLSELDIIGDL